MHLAPEEALFADGARRTGPLRVGAFVASILVNAAAEDVRVHAVVGAAGALALVAAGLDGHGTRAVTVGVAGLAVVTGLAALCVPGSPEVARAGARTLAAVPWCVWFSSGLRWPSVRRALRRSPLPAAIPEFAETSVAQSMLLLDELTRFREAMALRHGLAGRGALRSFAAVLAGGVERALDRAVRLDVARTVRNGPAPPPPGPAAQSASALRFCEVSLRLGDDFTFGPVSLQIAPGEWVAVAGPSGSGKTTMLRLAAGIEEPTTGDIARFGAPVPAGALTRRVDPRVGWVGQDPSDQLFGATPGEDVAWGLRRRGADEARAACDALAALAALGLAGAADRPIHRLSFGERRRVAFAGALAGRPGLLLCDEPTSGLDPVAAAALAGALERSATPDLAVVWVTHDLASLPDRIARVVLVRAGRVVFDGPRAEALRPSRLAEAGLLPGAAPC